MHPLFSVIIPVLNEETAINSVIEHIGHLQGGPDASEIIVVDGDPEGKTIKAITDKKVVAAIGKKGRGNQMNKGAALAHGDVLVFLHVDTRLPLNAFAHIHTALYDSSYKAGAFDLAIASDRPAFRLIARSASLRSRLTRIPYGDQTHFFRRDYFHAIGGFADIPIMEDVEIMRRVKKRGEAIVFISQPSSTSARRWEKEGLLKCTLRNWFLLSLYIAGVSPERLARWYR